MEDCLRRSCPCLRALWDRIFKKGGLEGTTCGNSKPQSVENENSRYVQPTKLGDSPPVPEEPEPSTIYVALWAFEARDDDELSFEPGDRFRILSRNGNWWTAEKLDPNGRALITGVVPYNYLEPKDSVESQPWFFGKMNRIECLSHLLTNQNEDRAFLVRLSETGNIGHVLSVKVNKKAKHFKIHQSECGYFVEQSCIFLSLVALIQHYQIHQLGSMKLGKPCIRRVPQPQDLSHTTVDEWELPKEDFTLEHKLGSGFFAEVYRGKWKKHQSVAIKVLKNNGSTNQREFHMEVEALKLLRHNHLISLFAICTSSIPYFIITEYMEKGNLLDFLRSKEGTALDSDTLIDMAYQVADGMMYLEKQKTIHRDLAARNVLVGEGYLCKVADFGLARFIKEPIYVSEEKRIPYKWTAPEAITHGQYSNKSDVWSFGILLYEIFSYGGIPYPGLNSNEVIRQITHFGYRLSAPPKCPAFINNIMTSCWSTHPDSRPDFKWLQSELMETINRYFKME